MFDDFREVIVMDFEYYGSDGDRPTPVCYVAHELRSGRRHRLWRDQLGPFPPHPIDADTLVVCYYASADLNCYRQLGWPMPENVLDPFAEFRVRTNGLHLPHGNGLVGAMIYFGLDTMGAGEKDYWRQKILTGGSWDADEIEGILAYCESDVDALHRLLPMMADKIDLPRAVGIRGRYMIAASAMEHAGVPIDTEVLRQFREYWSEIQSALIDAVDRDYGVYLDGHFSEQLFARYLAEHRIPWPRFPMKWLGQERDRIGGEVAVMLEAGWKRVGQKLERWADQDWRRNWQVPEEDRRQFTSAHWDGKSYRYFRSPNVVCIEHYRRLVNTIELEPSAA